MAHIGQSTQRQIGADILARSRLRAALVPDLLVEARRVANTVVSGWHGRRRRGIGENFWQFRPFQEGENVHQIDWRRSGRDDGLYIRDREWEAVHTIWMWADDSQSMLYQSQTAQTSKQERALVLTLALTEVLARSGERVGYLGVTEPITHRQAAERISTALRLETSQAAAAFPHTAQIRPHSDLVIVSDFLDPIDATLERIDRIASSSIRGHLVHIIDPAEESFTYSGRTEFIDPERGTKLTAGRAEDWSDDYLALFNARKDTLQREATRRGWTHTIHHTDRPASEALVSLHLKMTAAGGN